jgi:hypothetical protein
MTERPQFFPNTLTPPTINTTTLATSLKELRVAVRNGAGEVKENTPLPESWGSIGIFRGFPGIELPPSYPNMYFISPVQVLPWPSCAWTISHLC